MNSSLSLLAAGTLLSSGALAQTDLWQTEVNLPWTLAHAGDLNGDGLDDGLVGSFANSQVRAFSGLDGRALFTLSEPDVWFGATLDGGQDVDGDGTPDIVVGAPINAISSTSTVHIYSGRTGQLLVEPLVPLGEGVEVALLGDVDGDGDGEWVLGSRLANGPAGFLTGALRFYSGLETQPYLEVFGGSPFEYLGSSLVSVADATGDGVRDLATPLEDGPGSVRVLLHSGATGALAMQWTGLPCSALDGLNVAGAGDFDGDGRAELLLGCPADDGAGPAAGRVYILSAASPLPLASLSGALGSQFGTDVEDAGDANGDGTPDLLIGARTANQPMGLNAGSVLVLSGSDGSTLAQFFGQGNFEELGAAVAYLPNVDGCGNPGYLASPGNASYVSLFSVADGPEVYCVAAPNSTGAGSRLASTGSLEIADNLFGLRASQAPAGQSGLFLYGPDAAQLPFGDGTLCLGSGTALRIPFPQVVDAAGQAELQLDFSAAPFSSGAGQVSAGSIWHFQFWFRDPAGPGGSGFNFGDGLRVRFCL